ncbi:MAG: hypothetical protein LBD77_00180 [Bifidobacteriaceae bacterium]|nr:hypothetical protein [Bifidobacteriaceae bacterium]
MVRLYNGERVSVPASGATKREADDKLRQAIDRRLGRRVDAGAITDLTSLYVVAGQFFDEAYREADQADARPKRKRQSVDCHASTWRRHLRPHLAEVKLCELTPALLEHVLNQIRQGTEDRPGSESKAKAAYTTLNLILKRAQAHGGLVANQLAVVDRPKPQPKPVVALEAQGVGLIRRAVRRYDDKRRAISKRQGGQAPRGDVVALLDVILGTGLRIGEVLALRWRDVVQDGETWLVDVNATMVELVGRGYQRQPVPKTDAGDRLVALPAFTVLGSA